MNDTEKKFAITALQDEVLKIRKEIYGLFDIAKRGEKIDFNLEKIWNELVRLEILASASAKIEMLNVELKGDEE